MCVHGCECVYVCEGCWCGCVWEVRKKTQIYMNTVN